MKKLNEERVASGIEIIEIAEELGLSCIFLARVFNGNVRCSKEVKDRVKNFLIQNYTKRIEKM